MAQYNTTELDFDQIKQNLKDYFKRSDSPYRDWDFEGSGLNNLLDILAYNTHYNAMNAHVAVNESFLDTAQVRANVVSRAKLLGYIPTSKTASVASIDLTLKPKTGVLNESYALSRGESFTATIDDTNYTFLLLTDSTAAVKIDANGNRSYPFKDLSIYQGVLKTQRFTADNSLTSQKYLIDDAEVDSSSLIVRVYDNPSSTSYTIYTRYSELSSSLDGNSLIYYIEENYEGKFQIHFGNNSIGKQPANNAVIEIDYLSTKGAEANGAAAFTWAGGSDAVVDGTSTIVVNSKSAGGSDIEDIESIRYNAPLSYISQNRAVTADDYQTLVKQLYGAIDSISVWGGEVNDPPQYGKAYISIKPAGALTTTKEEKELIVNGLQRKRVLSVEPVIVDPEYTYLFFNVFFKYNSNQTANTIGQMQTSVRNVISDFNESNLQNFDGVFRYSQFLRTIDNSDVAILNSFARVYVYKDIVINFGSSESISCKFNMELFVESDTKSIIQSSSWTSGGYNLYLGDEAGTGDNRNVYVYRLSEGEVIKTVNSVGSLNAKTGELSVNSSLIPNDKNEIIRIEVTPNSNDIISRRNNLLSIDVAKTTIQAEVDTVAVAGAAGSDTYNTFARRNESGRIISNTTLGTDTTAGSTSSSSSSSGSGSSGSGY